MSPLRPNISLFSFLSLQHALHVLRQQRQQHEQHEQSGWTVCSNILYHIDSPSHSMWYKAWQETRRLSSLSHVHHLSLINHRTFNFESNQLIVSILHLNLISTHFKICFVRSHVKWIRVTQSERDLQNNNIMLHKTIHSLELSSSSLYILVTHLLTS